MPSIALQWIAGCSFFNIYIDGLFSGEKVWYNVLYFLGGYAEVKGVGKKLDIDFQLCVVTLKVEEVHDLVNFFLGSRNNTAIRRYTLRGIQKYGTL